MWVLCLIYIYIRRIDICYVFLFLSRRLSSYSRLFLEAECYTYVYNLRRVSIALYGALHGFVYVCRGAKWGRFVNECAREVRSGTGSGSTMCWSCARARARAPTPRSLPRHVQFMRRDKLCFPPFATGIRSFINSPHVIFIFLYIRYAVNRET